jgi:hypothetical protein
MPALGGRIQVGGNVQRSKGDFRNLAIFSCLAIFLWLYSCASLREWKSGGDAFARTYAGDFMSFHPKLNSALQDYAKRHKGNSFQIARLGSDAVIIQGIYQGERDQGRYSTTITIKPAGARKSRMEIKISAKNAGASSTNLEEVARDLFQILEQGAGFRPLE